MARGVLTLSAALVVSLGAACSAVLGLDAPTLNPCAAHPCVDGAVDAGVPDTAASDAPVTTQDAGAKDTGSDAGAIVGIRCGGGSFPLTGCPNVGDVCCETTTDAGASFDCRSGAAACDGGYPIYCSNNNDCPGSDVCCHEGLEIKCISENSCANSALVCEPDGSADQCPSGYTCSAALVLEGVTSPYYACTQ